MAVDILPPAERGFANGLQVAGYRVGMIVGGGVLLGLHDQLGNRGTTVSSRRRMPCYTAPSRSVAMSAGAPRR